jgi:AraC-like DNA-binding protein
MARGEVDKAPYDFEFIAAPEGLRDYLNSLYIFRSEERALEDSIPAYSGQLLCFLNGKVELDFDDASVMSKPNFYFSAPLMRARAFRLSGPALAVGASLNFRGWAALTGLPVNRYNDMLLPVQQALSADLAEALEKLGPDFRAGRFDERAMLDHLAEIIREGIAPLSPKHSHFIGTMLEWLSSSFRPELDDLQERLSYSPRQIQRLASRFFGQSPIHLVRRYRAMRAATLFSLPELPELIEYEIREAFYDQAHLIKEIRYFTGRTPTRLLPKDGSPVTDMLGPDGYGSVDLFGGNEAEQLDDQD